MGILLRDDSLDSLREFDLSGMTLPVARAACRYVVNRIDLNATDQHHEDLSFITGVGSNHQDGGTSLREHVQEVLRADFNPPLGSTVPKHAQGIVLVDASALRQRLLM